VRLAVHLALALAPLLALPAAAQCPPSCFGGGGPAATDCFLSFGGVAASTDACTDGDPSCDQDGTIDGRCTLTLTACACVPSAACSVTALDAPPTAVATGTGAAGVQPLASAVAALPVSGESCTAPGLAVVPVTQTPAKLKPGVATLKTVAVAGGKKDKDKLKLSCAPGHPTLARDVQPIFTELCTYSGCHSGPVPQGNLSLEDGQSLASLVNQKSTSSFKLVRVKPGNLKKSFLAQRVLGLGNLPRMPSACPDVVAPVTRCLTDQEIYVILAWIQAGAQP
jgi:hypothetical protein